MVTSSKESSSRLLQPSGPSVMSSVMAFQSIGEVGMYSEVPVMNRYLDLSDSSSHSRDLRHKRERAIEFQVVINITTGADYWISQAQLFERSTTDSPRRTQMKGMLLVVMTPTTISCILPCPPTVHATKNIVKLLQSKLLQGPLECFLGVQHPELLLHLLEEVRCMEP